MPNDLLTYYERELSFLRQTGAEFAANYPKIASRLLLEADTSEDPHVERLIRPNVGPQLSESRLHQGSADTSSVSPTTT